MKHPKGKSEKEATFGEAPLQPLLLKGRLSDPKALRFGLPLTYVSNASKSK